MLPVTNDVYTPVISQYMRIDETFLGDDKKGILMRYRGQLYNSDSAQAYDQLSQALTPLKATPLFRLEDNRQVIVLMNGVIQPKPSKAWPNVLVFILTLLCVMFVGAGYGSASADLPTTMSSWVKFLLGGLPFAIALLAILLCHEFGHYLAARYHKTAVTLPFFLPIPVGFGTLGAFIQLRQPPKNRRILLDIGIAGPLAGLVIAIPILLYGLYHSPVNRLPTILSALRGFEGNSILYLLLKLIIKGQILPQPVTYAGLNPIVYWIRYFFTGTPLPAGGLDVSLNPIAWAGWIGLLVTALNLIPAGQLDGGHVVYVLLGKRASRLLPFILLVLVGLSFFYPGWLIWAAIIFVLGRAHAEPLDQITPLDSKRRLVAILGVIIFILVFMPVPLY